jgi:hypothetical protein
MGDLRRLVVGWRARRALHAAVMLEQAVDQQLSLLAPLSEDNRRHCADYLAQLVMLAQSHRLYASGAIDRRELTSRARAAVGDLEVIRARRPDSGTDSAVRLTERD